MCDPDEAAGDDDAVRGGADRHDVRRLERARVYPAEAVRQHFGRSFLSVCQCERKRAGTGEDQRGGDKSCTSATVRFRSVGDRERRKRGA
jgi:hypothetical protein